MSGNVLSTRSSSAARPGARGVSEFFTSTSRAALLATVVAGAAAAPLSAAAAATPDAEVAQVSEIVVTAQKREENVQTVGMSIQAATGEQLARRGVTDVAQLSKLAPGFSSTPSGYGTPIFSIRGVSFQDSSLAAVPAVSVYADEMPLPYSIMTAGALLDLERVEILKGPQGTLYGQNSTGGAINFVANKPTPTFQAGFDGSYGRFNTADLAGFVSGPIADGLEGRVAIQTVQAGDWQKSYTHPATSGAKDIWIGRAQLRWEPVEHFSALLTVSGFRDRSDTQQAQLFGFAPTSATNSLDPRIIGSGPVLLNPPYINQGYAGHYPFAPRDNRAADWAACVNTSPLNPPFDTQPPGAVTSPTQCTDYRKDNRQYVLSLRAQYELPNGMTLTSLTSYERFWEHQPIASDGTIYQVYQSLQKGDISTAYQELRLAGRFAEKGRWTVGANYGADDTLQNYLESYGHSTTGPSFGLPLTATTIRSQVHSRSWAAFADGEYPLFDSLRLVGGIRYTETKKRANACTLDTGNGQWAAITQVYANFLEFATGHITEAQYTKGGPGLTQDASGAFGYGVNPGPGGCGGVGPGPTFNPVDGPFRLDQDNVSWRAGLNWDVHPSVMLYGTVSQGYKAGSFPALSAASYAEFAPVTQESLLSYELGEKATLFDRTLRINAAVFYYDYKDKQIRGAIVDPIFGPLPALVNVPKSHIWGFEVNGDWRPPALPGLSLAPSLTYTHSEVDSCAPGDDPHNLNTPGFPGCYGGAYHNYDSFGNVAKLTGQAFPNTPEWAASLDAEYRWTLANGAGAYVGASATYQSSTSSFFNDDTATNQPSDILRLPGYTLVDLRAGVERDAWRFEVWGRNVTDQFYLTSSGRSLDTLTRYTGMPATYGLTFSYRLR